MRLRCTVLILALMLASCGSSSAESTRTPASSPPPRSETPTTTSTASASSTATTSTTAASPGKTACGPSSARTLAASRSARVYSLGAVVYGCTATGKKPIRLGQNRTCLGAARVTVVTLSGDVAAYGLQMCGVDTATGSVTVRRLSDGNQLHSFSATSGPVRAESARSVTSIVVKPNGAVAWIGVASSIISHRSQVEVDAASGASSRVLDRGSRIDPHSLRLRGSLLTWSDGGRTRSASLQ